MSVSSTKINLDYNDLDSVKCDKCEGEVFTPAVIMKRIPALVSPSGQATLAPAQVYQCCGCGHINKEFLPK